jgi:hypothetical protein
MLLELKFEVALHYMYVQHQMTLKQRIQSVQRHHVVQLIDCVSCKGDLALYDAFCDVVDMLLELKFEVALHSITVTCNIK